MPQSLLTGQLKEKPTYIGFGVFIVHSSMANPHDINTYLFLFHEGDKSVRNREIRDKEKLRDKQFPVRHFPQVFLVQIGQAFQPSDKAD
jgi:hypothetical protein